jgi:membrane protein DedA with SNARE-associated domain
MLDRFGKYIRVTQRRLDQITQKIGTSAIPIIIVARFTPGFTVASSIACGLSKIPYKEFLAAVSTHTLAWEMIFLAMGILGGRVSEYLNLESRHTLLAVWIAVVITVAAGAGYLVFRRARNSA